LTQLSRVLLALAGLCALGALALLLAGGGLAAVGPLVVGFFVLLATGASGHPRLRSHSFTVWIFAGVAAAMYYPSYFQEVGGFDLNRLIIPLVQVIMFGMGTAMSLRDFAGVVRSPRGVLVGLACQLTMMPLIALGLVVLFGFPPEVSAGIILIGSAPSGVASNVMAYIARANLALSITLTAVATLLAPLTTPTLMKLLAGELVPVDFVAMMMGVVRMVILPIVLGLIVHKIFERRSGWIDRAMPLLSMIGIAVVIAIITAAGRDALLTIGPLLFVAAVLHNGLGYLFGYWGCRLVGLDEQSCRTISIEVGMQNGGLASGLAQEMGKVATVGLAPAIFSSWMNVTGSALANWFRNRPLPSGEARPPADEPVEIAAT
jgi:bile acid:Na+ symporter, BASS family